MKSKLIDMTGQQCGKWIVLSRDGGDRPTRWLCRCKCGTTKSIVGTTLRNGTSSQCLSCRSRKYDTPLEKRWARAKNRAKLRGFDFNISPDGMLAQLNSQNGRCALSNLKIRIEDGSASLDRIDSTLGYIVGNIQWLHKDVNNMKMDLDQDRFIELCSRITRLTRGE